MTVRPVSRGSRVAGEGRYVRIHDASAHRSEQHACLRRGATPRNGLRHSALSNLAHACVASRSDSEDECGRSSELVTKAVAFSQYRFETPAKEGQRASGAESSKRSPFNSGSSPAADVVYYPQARFETQRAGCTRRPGVHFGGHEGDLRGLEGTGCVSSISKLLIHLRHRAGFDPAIRWFESSHPSQLCRSRFSLIKQIVGGRILASWAA